MKKKKELEPKLNKDLCPKNFKICVPRSSKLLGYNWEAETQTEEKAKEQWADYLKTLTPNHELPSDYKPDDGPVECTSCDCRPGWELTGKLAVAHACRVHDKIHRQVLSLEKVSAIDVGFAIWERQAKFGKFLAIRIHVSRKLPPEQLLLAGLTSFTQPGFAPGIRSQPELERRDTGQPDLVCCSTPKWKKLKEVVRRELGGKKKLLKSLGRYPISGVMPEDLSIFCPLDPDLTHTLDHIRLCICGVPIDIVNAQYNPSTIHPGGDAERGVFADPPQRSNQLKNNEHMLTGRGRVNPLVGGISVGSVTGQAGTLSTIVWDRTDGTPCVLSNWHVLAGRATAQVNQPTYQPALFDGGTEKDVVAHLKRWHLGEEGDAAIAELSGNRAYASGEVLGMWHPVSGYLRPSLNMEIRKWGRTTGFTRGFVDGIHLATNIDYGGGVVRYFKNQFHIAPLRASKDVSQVGDSGSLVLTSFRPKDQQDDLTTLLKWLRQCCDARGGAKLCEEISLVFDELLGGTTDPCPAAVHQALGEAISEITEACDPCSESQAGNNTEEKLVELCRLIDKHREILKEKCAEIMTCWRFCLHVDEIFEEWYENSKETSASASGICNQISRDSKKLKEKCPADVCSDFCTALETATGAVLDQCNTLECACDTISGRDQLCQIIQEQRSILWEKCSNSKDCVALCTSVEEHFEQWHARCEEIVLGEKQFAKLCGTLQEKYPNSTCMDPGKLIDCIESADSDRSQDKPSEEVLAQAKEMLQALIHESGHDDEDVLEALIAHTKRHQRRQHDEKARDTTRAYYAVGMIFAGDTPGSPFGEFAVASDITKLAEELRFSLQPVFEPRSSFRELRERPPGQVQAGRALRSGGSLTPGTQGSDPRGGGPQPDLEPAQGDPGSRTGGG